MSGTNNKFFFGSSKSLWYTLMASCICIIIEWPVYVHGFILLMISFSLNFSRAKIFAGFAVLSQTIKILASKYLSRHTFSLRNALSLWKFYPGVKKSGSTVKISPPKNLGYTVCNGKLLLSSSKYNVSLRDS